MTDPNKSKGDAKEREIAAILSNQLGINVRRLLGAGRKDDVGDLDIPGVTAQVAWWPSNTLRAFRQKPLECEVQQINAGTDHGWTFVRMVGGVWRATQTIEQFCSTYRELDT